MSGEVIPFPTPPEPVVPPEPIVVDEYATFADFVEDQVTDFQTTVATLDGLNEDDFWTTVLSLHMQLAAWAPSRITEKKEES